MAKAKQTVSKEKKVDFQFIELNTQTLNLKKADFFNKAVFLSLIAVIVMVVVIFGYIVNQYKDRFYLIKGKEVERIFDPMKLSEQVAINNAYNFLEFNPSNAKRKITTIVQFCVPKSNAYHYILSMLNGGYVSNTLQLSINRIFNFQDVKSEKLEHGYKHTVRGVQSNINEQGTDNKDIIIIFETIFYQMTDKNPTGYRIQNIVVKSTKPQE